MSEARAVEKTTEPREGLVERAYEGRWAGSAQPTPCEAVLVRRVLRSGRASQNRRTMAFAAGGASIFAARYALMQLAGLDRWQGTGQSKY